MRRRPVLNALRHQWNPHSHLVAMLVPFDRCSTPCGINGILTAAATQGLYVA